VPRPLTVRSPLAMLAALTNTALAAACFVGLAFAIGANAVGPDWIVVRALLLFALVVLLLPLRLRLTVSAEGIVIQNLIVRHRIPWSDVDRIAVERLDAAVLIRGSLDVPGIVVRRHSTMDAEAFASWGLGRRRRELLAAALRSFAKQHCVRCAVDAPALKLRGGRDTAGELEPAVYEPTREEIAWLAGVRREAGAEVECVACGRRAAPAVMEPFGEEGDALAWYCGDATRCAAA
jgi:hypothetical protein